MERKLESQQNQEQVPIKMIGKKSVYVADFKIKGHKYEMLKQDDKYMRD